MAKRAKVRKNRKSPPAPKSRSRGSVPLLSALPTEALAAELRRRRSELPKLEKHASGLRVQLAAVERRIAELSAQLGIASTAKPPRPSARKSAPPASPRATRNGQPTIGAQITDTLSERGGVLSPRDLAGILAPRLGREVTTNFLVQISLTLARLVKQGRVQKIGRGQYRAAVGEGAGE
jgi:predicted transcriptional regulator of viral defense system